MTDKKIFGLQLWISIQLIILLVAAYYIFSSNHENVEFLFNTECIELIRIDDEIVG